MPMPWLRPLLLASILAAASGADRPEAMWHISIAWEDVSCDEVCQMSGWECTEECWPSTALGLQALTESQLRLKGTCFGIEAGPEATDWYPAKDPETKVCYWDAGSPSVPRCPVVPNPPTTTTPTTTLYPATEGQLFRRLCPCINVTEVYQAKRDNIPLECGLGSEPAAPVAGAAGSPSRSTAAPSGGATQSPSPSATQSPSAAPSPPPSAMKLPGCDKLDVSGFENGDVRLNGRYGSVFELGTFSHWHKESSTDTIILRYSDTNRWEFLEVIAAMSNRSLGTAVLTSSASSIPSDTFFQTITGGNKAQFSCFNSQVYTMDAAAAALAAAELEGGNGDLLEDSGGGNVGIVVGILAVVLCIGVAALAVAYLRSQGLRSYRNMDKPAGSDAERKGSGKVAQAKTRKADAGAGGRGYSGSPLKAGTTSDSWRPSEVNTPTRAARAMPVPGHETAAEKAVANVLGRTSQPRPGDPSYEGPLNVWWDGGGKPADERPPEMFSEVRLCNLVEQATWNGSEGTVEFVDEQKHTVHVRLGDGRLKAVKWSNVEPLAPSTVPRAASTLRTGGWREGGGDSTTRVAPTAGTTRGPDPPPFSGAFQGKVEGAAFCANCGARFQGPQTNFCGDCGAKRPSAPVVTRGGGPRGAGDQRPGNRAGPLAPINAPEPPPLPKGLSMPQPQHQQTVPSTPSRGAPTTPSHGPGGPRGMPAPPPLPSSLPGVGPKTGKGPQQPQQPQQPQLPAAGPAIPQPRQGQQARLSQSPAQQSPLTGLPGPGSTSPSARRRPGLVGSPMPGPMPGTPQMPPAPSPGPTSSSGGKGSTWRDGAPRGGGGGGKGSTWREEPVGAKVSTGRGSAAGGPAPADRRWQPQELASPHHATPQKQLSPAARASVGQEDRLLQSVQAELQVLRTRLGQKPLS